MLFNLTLPSQNLNVDISELKPEYFSKSKLKNGAMITDVSGTRAKLYISVDGKTKGFKIKNKKKWLKHGKYFTYNSLGKLVKITPYVLDRIHGVLKRYGKNGTVCTSIEEYEGNIKDGHYSKYLETGEKIEEGIYENNKLNGIRTIYFKNGDIKTEVPFVNGKKHGSSKYYDKGGKLRTITDWQNGKRIKSY